MKESLAENISVYELAEIQISESNNNNNNYNDNSSPKPTSFDIKQASSLNLLR
jgi:hypothetical protein